MSTGALAPSRPSGGENGGSGGLAARRPSRYIRATTPLEFRVLGPLQVASNGTSLPLGGTKQRAVLALLLLRANEVVPLDRLIDELWGESPPDSAANIVQGYVSHLRKTLEPGRERGKHELLVSRQPGYMLKIGRTSTTPIASSGSPERAGAFWKREMPTPRPNACGLLSTSGVGPRSPTSRTSRSRAWRRNASRSSGSSCSRTGSTPISRSAVTVCSSASYASSSRNTRSASGCGRS